MHFVSTVLNIVWLVYYMIQLGIIRGSNNFGRNCRFVSIFLSLRYFSLIVYSSFVILALCDTPDTLLSPFLSLNFICTISSHWHGPDYVLAWIVWKWSKITFHTLTLTWHGFINKLFMKINVHKIDFLELCPVVSDQFYKRNFSS